jgi:hypothetical protein
MFVSCNSLKSICLGSLAIRPFRVHRGTVAGRAETLLKTATMKIITLSDGSQTQVDDLDFAHKGYAARRVGSARQHSTQWVFMASQIIHPPKGLEADHRDGNKLNNLRSNLRPATHSQNNINVARKNLTGYRGVRLQRSGKFAAQIRLNGRVRHLGTFQRADIAASAYDESAIRHHGEFAMLNFPNSKQPNARSQGD